MPIASSSCYLHFWPTSCKLEVPTTSSLGSITRVVHRIQEIICSVDHQLIIQRYNSGIARSKRCIGQCMEKGHWAFMLSPGTLLSLYLGTITNPEALRTLSFWDFMEASLHRHGWSDQHPCQMNQSPALLSSLEVRRLGLNIPPPNHVWLLWQLVPHL